MSSKASGLVSSSSVKAPRELGLRAQASGQEWKALLERPGLAEARLLLKGFHEEEEERNQAECHIINGSDEGFWWQNIWAHGAAVPMDYEPEPSPTGQISADLFAKTWCDVKEALGDDADVFNRVLFSKSFLFQRVRVAKREC